MTPADTEQASRDLAAMVKLVARAYNRGLEVRIFNSGNGRVEVKLLRLDGIVSTEHLLKAALGGGG